MFFASKMHYHVIMAKEHSQKTLCDTSQKIIVFKVILFLFLLCAFEYIVLHTLLFSFCLLHYFSVASYSGGL